LVNKWFRAEKPDAVIAAHDFACRNIATSLRQPLSGRVGFVSANKEGGSIIAGIEERPEEIGASAIDQLAAMTLRGERGVPTVPKTTMVEGEWVEGRSIRLVLRRLGRGTEAARNGGCGPCTAAT
jgi:hypothetical protein